MLYLCITLLKRRLSLIQSHLMGVKASYGVGVKVSCGMGLPMLHKMSNNIRAALTPSLPLSFVVGRIADYGLGDEIQ
jgi:hypothetical protein